ncbi:MAG TPA: winged helix DNA-binding domain-containing protein [Acidimicrobiia bacterium]|nr:winged helix DNA-binding domain-containing protein [Acidimicrobiia bacterium]
MRRISDRERRARLAIRHHLAPSAKATDVVALAEQMVGLHSTDPATVVLAAAARLKLPTVEGVERALYDDRTLVRTLCMRRTLFVVPVDLVPIVQAAVTEALVPPERKRTVRMIEEAGIARDGARWLRQAEAETIAAIEARGEITGADLSKVVPRLRKQIPYGEGKTWAGKMGMTTRVLFLLACEQRVVRGRPKGSWTSTRYRWAPMTSWLPDGIPTLKPDEARAELARRWLAAFGPGTVADLKWWTGWTLGQTRKAVAELDTVEVELDHGDAGVVLAGDDAPVRSPKPWAALLPSLDPTTMGWAERAWYLGPHKSALFDRAGNAGPTVWWDGRIVGGWTQRADGQIVWRALEDIGSDGQHAVERQVERLQRWLAGAVVVPRFPTPLFQELRRELCMP